MTRNSFLAEVTFKVNEIIDIVLNSWCEPSRQSSLPIPCFVMRNRYLSKSEKEGDPKVGVGWR